MQILLDIPEEMYNDIKSGKDGYSNYVHTAIRNGTPHKTVTEFADRCRECGREKVLDKIRAEIFHLHDWAFDRDGVLKIIDKYKAESEDKEQE